jgi:MYXO-CTERM domain-containing protein
VNTALVGSYAITYDVTDSSGNAAAQVTRAVRVAPREGTGGGGGGANDMLALAWLALALYFARRRGRQTR